MTQNDILEYYQTQKGKAVKEFIEKVPQEAVVYSVTYRGVQRIIRCYSPVWKDVTIVSDFPQADNEVQRGDILLVFKHDDKYDIAQNKTEEQIKKDGTKEILKNFDEKQKQMIALISYFDKNMAKQ